MTSQQLFQSGNDNQLRYLAQFVHVNCGGAPTTLANGSLCLGCTACKKIWPWEGPLGQAVAQAGFRSLVV